MYYYNDNIWIKEKEALIIANFLKLDLTVFLYRYLGSNWKISYN